MRKIFFLRKSLFNIIAVATLFSIGFSACTESSESKLTFSSKMDSLSYAIGTEYYANTGMKMHLSNPNLELLIDTAEISKLYKAQIDIAEDDAKKNNLQKELKLKIDSIKEENQKVLNEVARGLADANTLKTRLEKAYVRGLSLGLRIEDDRMINKYAMALFGSDEIADEINREAFFAGINTSLTNSDPVLKDTEEIITRKIQENSKAREEQDRLVREKYAHNAVAGKEFLDKNKLNADVVELSNGVQYKVLKQGSGAKPNVTDSVVINFKGTLIDGTVFHSTSEVNQKPLIFTLDKILQSWSLVIQQMPVGSKWVIYIPESQAYGLSEVDKIPPLSTLIFETELLSIKSKK